MARCAGLWRVETGCGPSYASGGVLGRQPGRWTGIWDCLGFGSSARCQSGAVAGFGVHSRSLRVYAGNSVIGEPGREPSHCVKRVLTRGFAVIIAAFVLENPVFVHSFVKPHK